MQIQSIGFILMVAFVMGLGASTDAQQTDQQQAAGAGTPEFIDLYNRRFEKRPPLLDSVIENLDAYDENGKRISFDDFRGKYTVLTFGCLT